MSKSIKDEKKINDNLPGFWEELWDLNLNGVKSVEDFNKRFSFMMEIAHHNL